MGCSECTLVVSMASVLCLSLGRFRGVFASFSGAIVLLDCSPCVLSVFSSTVLLGCSPCVLVFFTVVFTVCFSRVLLVFSVVFTVCFSRVLLVFSSIRQGKRLSLKTLCRAPSGALTITCGSSVCVLYALLCSKKKVCGSRGGSVLVRGRNVWSEWFLLMCGRVLCESPWFARKVPLSVPSSRGLSVRTL